MRIKSFRHKGLKRLYEIGDPRGISSKFVAKPELIIHAIEQAQYVEQIAQFPGWKLHPLKGGKARRVERVGDRQLSVYFPR